MQSHTHAHAHTHMQDTDTIQQCEQENEPCATFSADSSFIKNQLQEQAERADTLQCCR